LAANVKNKGPGEAGKLVIVLVVALLLRIILALFETEVGVDSVHYILMGDNIAHGRGFETWNTTGGTWILPPTFPLLIAIFRLLGFSLEWSGHIASIVAGTALLVPLYYLTKRLFNQTTANIAILIGSFTPILVDYSVVILTELLFVTFVLSMMLFVIRAYSGKGTVLDSFLSGLFSALAFLTKTFGIFLLPFLLLGYLFSRGGKSKVPGIKHALMALIAFLILAVPYWVMLHSATGDWTIDGKGTGQESRIHARNLTEEHIDPRYAGILTDDGSDFAINQDQYPFEKLTGIEFAVNYVKKYAQKLVRIYQDFPFTPTYPNNVLLLYLFPAMLLGIGLFSGPGRWKDRDSDRFLLYWICPFVFGIPLIFVEVRYFIPLIPLLIPFMARGIEEIAALLVVRFPKFFARYSRPAFRPAIVIVVAVFILLAVPKLTWKITKWSDPMVSYNPRKIAASWLMSHDYSPGRIMEYGHSVSFYCGAQSILVPDADLESVISIARKYDIEILSLDEFYVLRANRRPEIEFLFDTESPPPVELERIYVDERFNGLKHVIYRIRTPDEIASGEISEIWSMMN